MQRPGSLNPKEIFFFRMKNNFLCLPKNNQFSKRTIFLYLSEKKKKISKQKKLFLLTFLESNELSYTCAKKLFFGQIASFQICFECGTAIFYVSKT